MFTTLESDGSINHFGGEEGSGPSPMALLIMQNLQKVLKRKEEEQQALGKDSEKVLEKDVGNEIGGTHEASASSSGLPLDIDFNDSMQVDDGAADPEEEEVGKEQKKKKRHLKKNKGKKH